MSMLFSQEEVTEMYVREREEEALNRGLERGHKEGFASGQKEGERKNALENAKNLLKEGLSPELIARALNLPLSEIEKIKEQMETESSH